MRSVKPREDYDSVEDPQAQPGWMPAWMAPVTIGNGQTRNPQPVPARGGSLGKLNSRTSHM
ncbi:hypothetical protein BBBOND_0109490 [Babesia bigemina]|uniref:Uncharacterized protein n=1 Tax=Babesia bigemina TaxID=5866 RepID=A0A061D1H6_BABBI|nr:hypothetical protein BBBOND_0109490 [Babesia bigemina]CDR94651.1 hypothetical protein BBBOND_0109490 [Babesia bigemina]|eukprot:XP_012766837.1 hypothetical protein BBBOND_0109490 [Babesia bigemina]